MRRTVVLLWDLINWKVTDVNIRRKFRFERSPNLSELLPNHSAEERMLFNGRCTIMCAAFVAESVICIAQEAEIRLATMQGWVGKCDN